MTRNDIKTLMRRKGWSVVALAEHWGMSRQHVTAQITNTARGNLWNDAFNGLDKGPGLYREGQRPRLELQLLSVGDLVASEADMDTFDYGARGVVVDVDRRAGEWTVVWDGGTVMKIDRSCLRDWVADLGLTHMAAARLRGLPYAMRVTLAKDLDLLLDLRDGNSDTFL